MACFRVALGAIFTLSLVTSCIDYGAQLPEFETEGDTTGATTTGSNSELLLLTGGNRFGECIGNCRLEISFQPTVLQLVVSDYSGSVESAVNYGVLTQLGQMELAEIDAELGSASLQDLYGCPDCDDSGASWVRINRVGQATDHLYERGNPPPELERYDSFLQTVITSLQVCGASDYITPDAECTAVP